MKVLLYIFFINFVSLFYMKFVLSNFTIVFKYKIIDEQLPDIGV